jgi:hypothetical protein
MKIEALLTEAEISEEFAEAMEARDIPKNSSGMLACAWLALAQDVAYEAASFLEPAGRRRGKNLQPCGLYRGRHQPQRETTRRTSRSSRARQSVKLMSTTFP